MELFHKTIQRFPVISRELQAILAVTVLFIFFPGLIRQVDQSAAAIDAGILSALILTIASVLIFQAITWWIIRTIWPVFSSYSIHHFENNFKSLQSWQKSSIYLGFYLALLYSFVAVLGQLV